MLSPVLMRIVPCLLVLLAIGRPASASADDEPWDEDDFYTLMEISQEAPLAAVKKAYRRLSLRYHPDTAGTGGAEVFQKLLRAYEVLSDSKLRRVYDQEGAEGVEAYEKRQAQGEQRMHDPFASMFGFGGGAQPSGKRPSVEVPLFISLKDLYLGKTFEASVLKQTRCKKCRGTGAKTKKDLHTCHHCKGTGVVVGVRHIGGGMYQQVRQGCPHCQGKGKTIGRTCNHCHGKKIVHGVENVTVVVEKGMPDHHTIVFDSMCDEVAGSTDAPGDLRFRIDTIATGAMKRDKSNILLSMELSLQEALLGFRKEMEHFDGHVVEIKRVGKITPHGLVEKIKGEGMPVHERPSQFGDLVVTYSVVFPTELTEQQRIGIQEILR